MVSQRQQSSIQFRKNVQKALKEWSNNNYESPLENLHLFRKLRREQASSIRQTANQVLLSGIDALANAHPQDAEILQLRYLDGLSVQETANRFNIAESTVYSKQRVAINLLADMLCDIDHQSRAAHHADLIQRLEAPSYSHLVGVEATLLELLELLYNPDQPWLLSIEGIGGIGKTSLANALIQRAIEDSQFEDFGWISTRQTSLTLGGHIRGHMQAALTAEELIEQLLAQLLPKLELPNPCRPQHALNILQEHLKATPHLVVIDNLETVMDVESLLPTLQKLSNPSKFILTSREQLDSEPNVYHFAIQPLECADAIELIRQEAKVSNLPVLAESSHNDLQVIFDTVGGNPLALRLVVGQTHVYALDAVLEDLVAAQGQPTENLYTYIYRRSWESLAEMERLAFLAMPLTSQLGDDFEFLASVSGLDLQMLRTAMNKLVMLNLVDSRGGLYERYYSIHNLTRSFLQNQVAKWEQTST